MLDTEWRKSSFSSIDGACVEARVAGDGDIEVRNSRVQDGPWLTYTTGEWAAFLAGAKAGEFDI
jgi:hypothetical protein